jgi:hypothetical protein
MAKHAIPYNFPGSSHMEQIVWQKNHSYTLRDFNQKYKEEEKKSCLTPNTDVIAHVHFLTLGSLLPSPKSSQETFLFEQFYDTPDYLLIKSAIWIKYVLNTVSQTHHFSVKWRVQQENSMLQYLEQKVENLDKVKDILMLIGETTDIPTIDIAAIAPVVEFNTIRCEFSDYPGLRYDIATLSKKERNKYYHVWSFQWNPTNEDERKQQMFQKVGNYPITYLPSKVVAVMKDRGIKLPLLENVEIEAGVRDNDERHWKINPQFLKNYINSFSKSDSENEGPYSPEEQILSGGIVTNN